MSKHTPGPWHIDFSDFGTDTDSRGIPISDGGGLIADVAPLGGRVGDLCLASWHNFGDDEDIANASLIAAAPDLLAALEGLYRATNRTRSSPSLAAALSWAQVAIAKATGGVAVAVPASAPKSRRDGRKRTFSCSCVQHFREAK